MEKITKNLQFALLIVILISTVIAICIEIKTMFVNQSVTLADLLLMFLYLEVLAMVRVFWDEQSISITLPLTSSADISGSATSTGSLGKLKLPKVENNPGNPTLAFGDGNTGFYEPEDNVLRLSQGGSMTVDFGGTYVESGTSYSFALRRSSAGSAGSPTYTFVSDADTGMWRTAANTLGFSAGGEFGINISARTKTTGGIVEKCSGSASVC